MSEPSRPTGPPGPERDAGAAQARLAPSLMSDASPHANGPPRILVVDDTSAHRALMEQAFSKRGWRVATAADGQAGYDLALSMHPDVILLDLSMPEQDGFAVCERLKGSPATADIPVIVLTARTDTGDKVRAFQLGSADYITKPFQIAELVARVETQLRIRRYEERILQYQEQLEVTLAAQQLLTRQAVLTEQRASIHLLAIESALDAILIGDRRMRIQHANAAAADVYGRGVEELQGVYLTELCAGAGAEDLRERLAEGEPFDREVQQAGADGAPFFAHIRGVSIRGAGDASLGYVVVVRDITRQKEMERQLEHLATTDQLTDLPNRRTFDLRLAQEVSRAGRHGTQLGLAIMDIDRFKRVNDTYGHQAGDSSLALTAYILAACVRTEDVLCRYGGEEFALIAPETGTKELAALCERLRATIAATPVSRAPDGTEVHVTLTAGVSYSLGSEKSADQLVREADAACYAGKAAGRDRVVVFENGQAIPRPQVA